MTKPATISILGKTWCRAESFEQFRYQEPTNRTRRNGLKYYILYCAGDLPKTEKDTGGAEGVLIQQTISQQTDPAWLEKAIKAGHIYLEKLDFDVTKTAINHAAKN